MNPSSMPPRRRLQAVCRLEGRDLRVARARAYDLYTLLPAASRRQLDEMQQMPAESRRMAISEIFDALERGMAIINGRSE